MIKVIDRKTKKVYEEEQFGASILNFLYNTCVGRVILKILINPIISKIGGKYNDLGISKFRINKWIRKYNLDMSLYEECCYKNFNEFFTRKRKDIGVIKENKNFISPCEAKLSVYRISNDLVLNIKNSSYTMDELFQGEDLSEFKNGYCFLYHLTVDCYHRYCYIDDGRTLSFKNINGKLHTISSIAKDYKIYKENHRCYSILDTKNFDKVIYMEVGALMVGKIKNNNKDLFLKGEEKGYFELGGSTIVVLVKDNVVEVDKDILENTKKDIETKVGYMEKVGIKKK